MLKPIYISRKVLNANEITSWARAQGFRNVVEDDDMHVTIAYSTEPVNHRDFKPVTGIINNKTTGGRELKLLGEKSDTLVLVIVSGLLKAEWDECKEKGCSWSWPTYVPHVTLAYNSPLTNKTDIEPFEGTVRLGPQIIEDLNLDWDKKKSE